MKKAAILLSGLFREFNNMQNIIDNIITPNSDYEFHIICSIWDVILCKIDNNYKKIDDIKQILSIYNPTYYSILNYFEIIEKMQNNKSLINYSHHNLCQFYSCNKVIDALEEYEKKVDIKYDLIIRYRLDLFSSATINFKNFDLNYIHGIYKPNAFCNPDWFYFGNNESMKEFMKVYNNLISGKIEYNPIPEFLYNANANNSIKYDIPDSFSLNKHGIIQS